MHTVRIIFFFKILSKKPFGKIKALAKKFIYLLNYNDLKNRRRLLSTTRGYSNVTKASSNINLNAFLHFITHCLTIDDDYLNYAALDCFSSLIQPNSIQVDLATEQRNKSQLINSNGPFLSTLTDVLANNLVFFVNP